MYFRCDDINISTPTKNPNTPFSTDLQLFAPDRWRHYMAHEGFILEDVTGSFWNFRSTLPAVYIAKWWEWRGRLTWFCSSQVEALWRSCRRTEGIFNFCSGLERLSLTSSSFFFFLLLRFTPEQCFVGIKLRSERLMSEKVSEEVNSDFSCCFACYRFIPCLL